MVTNGYDHLSASEFNAVMLAYRATGGAFVYFTGWLPDAKRRVGDESVSEVHRVAKAALEAQEQGLVCLTQKCLQRGGERVPPIYEYRATVRRRD